MTDRDELVSRRRRLIWSGLLFGLVTVVAVVGLAILAFSSNNRGWNDDSRVVQTRGVVVEERRSSTGSCKGADFDTRLKWTQDGELRTAWTNTCRAGPDVGDEVDVWVRDDGLIVLTAPSATNVLIAVGVLFFAGLGVLVFFSVRSNLRRVTAQLAATE